MSTYQSNAIRKYIKQIKNEDIQDIQRSINSRYIDIEGKDIKSKVKKLTIWLSYSNKANITVKTFL